MQSFNETDTHSHVWPRLFCGLAAIYGVLILVTFWEYGITTDEPLHVGYGEHIFRWYQSGFSDRTVFISTNLWLYGGLFDTLVQGIRQVVPMDVYDLRHLMCALVGWVGVVGAYRIGTQLGGRKVGLLAALFLVLTPRYYGHAFNNTKDIPFAVGYLWGLSFLVQGVGSLPRLPWHLVGKIGLAIGLTLGVRASGLVLVVYLGLFYGIRYLQLVREGQVGVSEGKALAVRVVSIGVIAYGVLFPFYPWLQLHPLTGIWDSFRAFADFPEVHQNFFEGRYIQSTEIPRTYAVQWLLLTLPEFVLLGLCGLLGLRWKQMRSAQAVQLALVGFAAVFPLLFGALTRTPLLNGIRHMMFVVPPLVILSAAGVQAAVDRVSGWMRRTLILGFFALVLMVFADMIRLHPNQYVYFNRIFAGGLEKASTRYDTDYWNHSHKQGLRWIENQTNASDQKLRIGSLYENVRYMVDTTRFEFTDMPEDADFYLGNLRFDSHRAIPGETVHVVRATGVPLLYVIRPDSSWRQDPFFVDAPVMHYRLGDYYRARGDLESALQSYRQVLLLMSRGLRAVEVDSVGVYYKMGNISLGLDRYTDAMGYFEPIQNVNAFAGSIANNLGHYFLGKKAYAQALEWYQQAVRNAPEFYVARVNLGNMYLKVGQIEEAIASYWEAAQLEPSDSEQQYRMGMYFYQLERYGKATVCFERIARVRYADAESYYNLGLSRAGQKDYGGARRDFEKAVQLAPDHEEAYRSLGTVCMYLEDYGAAARAYQAAGRIAPDRVYLHLMLGEAYVKMQQYDRAKAAFEQVLEIDPEHEIALRKQRALETMDLSP